MLILSRAGWKRSFGLFQCVFLFVKQNNNLFSCDQGGMGKLIKASKMSEKVHFLLGGGAVHSLIGSSKEGEKPDLNRLDSSATETNLSLLVWGLWQELSSFSRQLIPNLTALKTAKLSLTYVNRAIIVDQDFNEFVWSRT